MNDIPLDLHEVTKMYQVLGLPMDASKTQVRHARNKLLAKFHPDKYETDPALNKEVMNDTAQCIQSAFVFIIEHYAAIQKLLEFLPANTLSNRIPVNVRSYWVYTSIENLSKPDQEA